MKFDNQGRELPDGTPLEVPLRFRTPETTDERITRMISTAMSNYAVEAGAESIDEANDFDIEGDDPDDTFTQHEELAMALELPDGYGRDATPDPRYERRRKAQGDRGSTNYSRENPDRAPEDREEGTSRRTRDGGSDEGEAASPRAQADPPPSRGASPRR